MVTTLPHRNLEEDIDIGNTEKKKNDHVISYATRTYFHPLVVPDKKANYSNAF